MGVAAALWQRQQVLSTLPKQRPAIPPLLVVAPPTRVGVFILPIDTSPGDSIRTILDRDVESGDWMHVLPLDSASNAVAIVHVTPTAGGVHVELIDGRTLRLYRAQDFALPAPAPAPAPRSASAMPTAHDSAPGMAVAAAAATADERQRWAIHGIADALHAWVTGHRGVAQSRIAYVSRHAIHLIDTDGAHDYTITHDDIALSPAWSHDGRALVYTDLNRGGSRIAEIDLCRGTRRWLAATLRGLNITPLYSPDDQWIVFAHGDDEGTSLVATRRDSPTTLRTVMPRRWGDLSSPTFRADGGRIAFVAARATTPQIYSVNADGTDERLETPFTSGTRSYRASPDWSPDGKTIAFEQQRGNFQIWLLALSDRAMHQLTSIGENEDPTWAPDSRHLAFTSTRRGKKDIWVLDLPSGRLRQVTRAGDARLAAWSPLWRSRSSESPCSGSS